MSTRARTPVGPCGARDEPPAVSPCDEQHAPQRRADREGRRGAVIALLVFGLLGLTPRSGRAARTAAEPSWPEGTRLMAFENLEGVLLINATLHGLSGHDTTGPLVLDTGAGFLAVDGALAVTLGLADSVSADEVGIAARVLPRLELGAAQIDQVAPVLTVDGDIVRRVTDRPVLGLVGQRLFAGDAVQIDYAAGRLALVPIARAGTAAGRGEGADAIAASRASLEDVLEAAAVAVPFRLAGDGKIVVEARVSDPRPPRYSRWLTLIVDTGATKCVLFDRALAENAGRAREWRQLRGLSAPTLFGAASASVARVPEIELRAGHERVRLSGLDVAVIHSDLSGVLSRATGEPVHGLLGYSFLRHYRVTIDYPHRVMWLERSIHPVDERPNEYSHVGIQLERDDRAARVVGVAEGSPAARAEVEAGDELVAIDGAPASSLDIVTLSRRLEGPPGSDVTLIFRRGTTERTIRLVRRRLL